MSQNFWQKIRYKHPKKYKIKKWKITNTPAKTNKLPSFLKPPQGFELLSILHSGQSCKTVLSPEKSQKQKQPLLKTQMETIWEYVSFL